MAADLQHVGHGHVGHGHVRPDGSRPGDGVRTTGLARRVVVVLAVACAVASVLGVALLWPPAGTLGALREQVSAGGSVATTVEAEVLSQQDATCQGTSLDRLPDGTIPASASCPTATVRVLEGEDAGRRVDVAVPAQVAQGGIHRGDRVDLSFFPASDGQPASWTWLDFSRKRPLAVVVGVFVLLTVLVARRRGLAALLGMALAGAVLGVFMIPALLAGESAVLVAVTGCSAIMGVVLYLTHGFSLRTAAAHLGTVSGLVLVGVAAHVAVGAVHLQGLSDEDSGYLGQLTSTGVLQGLVVAGMVLAGVGVLNDVTITQAAAVWEVREHAPAAGFATLVRSGMRVGRDHLASTVYTVAFAYAGAALPVLVIIAVTDPAWLDALTSSALAEEVVRTAIGGACVALSVPLTTAVAAAAVAGASVTGAPPVRDPHSPRDHGLPPPPVPQGGGDADGARPDSRRALRTAERTGRTGPTGRRGRR